MDGNIQVHPTLYELMEFMFSNYIDLYKHKKFDGEIMLLYLGGYALGRVMRFEQTNCPLGNPTRFQVIICINSNCRFSRINLQKIQGKDKILCNGTKFPYIITLDIDKK